MTSTALRTVARTLAAALLCSALPGQAGPATLVQHFVGPLPGAFDTARGQALLPGNPMQAWNGASWEPLLPAAPAPADALADDPPRGRIVAFSGSELHCFTGNTWTAGPGIPGYPGPRSPRLCLDADRDRLVLFGGGWLNSQGSHFGITGTDETWTFDGSSWTRHSPASSPPPRHSHLMAWDPVRRRVVLTGGSSSAPFAPALVFQDTWEWDGTAWTAVPTATVPSAPWSPAAIAWHRGTQRLWVCDPAGNTWAYDGTSWSALVPAPAPLVAATSGPSRCTLVDDGTTLLMVRTEGLGLLTATFRLDAQGWTLLPDTVAPAGALVLAHDSTRGEVVAVANDGWSQAHTFTWNGRLRWHAAAGTPGWGLHRGSLAHDAARGETVLFGGPTNTETWVWNGSTWTRRFPATAPSRRVFAALAWHPVRQRAVLFGGFPASAGGWSSPGLDDTWLWDGTGWTLDPGPRPPQGLAPVMHWDATRSAIVMANPSGTWEWDGGWVQRATTPPPNATCSCPDPATGSVLLFGSAGQHRWNGSAWVPVAPSGGPLPSSAVLHAGLHRVVASLPELAVLGPTPTAVIPIGAGCPGGPALDLFVQQRPAIGRVTTLRARTGPAAPTFFLLALQQGAQPAWPCTLAWHGPVGIHGVLASPAGHAALPIGVPGDPALRGLAVIVQGAALVPGGPLGGFTLSPGLRLLIGD